MTPTHDVFISYSSADRAHARRMAQLFEAAHINVWWDREIPLGQDYHDVIDEKLHTSRCIIVLWSEKSIGSKWVRSEASVGDERGVLVPIQIEPCRLPVAFRLLQTEQLYDADIDVASESWLRITARIKALVDPSNADSAALNVDNPPIEGSKQRATSGTAASRSSVLGWLVPSALFFIVWIYSLIYLGRSSSFLLTAMALAAAAFMFFRLVEHDINPQMRALVSAWMLPKQDRPRVDIAEALNHMFEAVFDRHHLTLKCLGRSMAISAFFLAFSLFTISAVYGRSTDITISVFLTILVVAFFVNGLGDYICLYKTRVLLRQHKNGWPILLIGALDTVLGPTIFVALLGAGVFALYAINVIIGETEFLGGKTLIEFWWQQYVRVLMQPYYEHVAGVTSQPPLFPVGPRRLLYSCIATSLLTSVWIWSSLLFAPAVRLLGWLKGRSFLLLALTFDVEKAPFSALGYLSSVFILALGFVGWGVSTVWAALL